MVLGLSKPRFSPISIDFGADSIKLLQIIPTDPPQLVAAAATLIPEEVRFDAVPRVAFLAETLKQLLRDQPFKGKRAILSTPAFQTLVIHMEFQGVGDDNLQHQVDLQLRQRLNVDPDRMVVRNFCVGQIVRGGQTQRQVICLAVGRDAVMRYIGMARRAKLDVVGMHGEPMAILRAFENLHQHGEDSAVGYIDLGAATTKLIIAHGPNMVFAKTIKAGGDHLTRRLAESQQMSFSEARKARITEAAGTNRRSAGPVGGAGGGAAGTAVASEPPGVESITDTGSDRKNETLEFLLDELQLSLRFYQSQYPADPIEKLVFVGGEARQVQTCRLIARTVRIAAQLGDPFARLTRIGRSKNATGVDLNEPQPGWAVPMGLCLSEANL